MHIKQAISPVESEQATGCLSANIQHRVCKKQDGNRHKTAGSVYFAYREGVQESEIQW